MPDEPKKRTLLDVIREQDILDSPATYGQLKELEARINEIEEKLESWLPPTQMLPAIPEDIKKEWDKFNEFWTNRFRKSK